MCLNPDRASVLWDFEAVSNGVGMDEGEGDPVGRPYVLMSN